MKDNVLLYFKSGYQTTFRRPESEEELEEKIRLSVKTAPGGGGQKYEVFFLSDEEMITYRWKKGVTSSKLSFGQKEAPEVNEKDRNKIATISNLKQDFFRELDVAMIRSLEGDPRFDPNKIKEKKQFLRTVPNSVEEFISKYGRKTWEKMNPFCNVFEIEILETGAGYIQMPHVSIAAPVYGNNKKVTWKKQATAIVELTNGSVSNIKITNHGCGYRKIPLVLVGGPPEGGTKCHAVITKIDFLTKENLTI